MASDKTPRAAAEPEEPAATAEAPIVPAGPADNAVDPVLAETTPAPAAPVEVAAPAAKAPATRSAADARQANRWYYVRRLGDGPAAIYSANGGSWDYAFACTLKSRTIEFIAVSTGDPGGFQGQAMRVGATRLNMDATYSKDHGGTISVKLPAKSAFLDTLMGGASFEVQLVQGAPATLPVNADVVRVIRDCRGS
jgi:hypothetical protein